MPRKIADYPCRYLNHDGFSAAIRAAYPFPTAYRRAELMVEVSKAVRAEQQAPVCMLPYSYTVEAELLGAQINYGDGSNCPRAGRPAYGSLAELLAAWPQSHEHSLMSEVLTACRSLKAQGETVELDISGPFSILDGVIGLPAAFRALRREPELMVEAFGRFRRLLLAYAAEAVAAGVDIISYSDPTGAVNILGMKHTGFMVREFVHPFISELTELTHGRTLLALCPKTTFMLLGSDLARLEAVQIEPGLGYLEGALSVRDRVAVIGQTCPKNFAYRVHGQRLRSLVLLPPAHCLPSEPWMAAQLGQPAER